MSKGSRRRASDVDSETFRRNYERLFGKAKDGVLPKKEANENKDLENS